MRTVIVGFGRIANTIRFDKKISRRFGYSSHAEVLSVHPGYDWRGVVDPSKEACLAASMDWNIEHVSMDLSHVVSQVGPEFAVLAIPPGARYEVVTQMPGLRALLIEKPMGREGRELLDYCASRNIRVYVNYWRRAVPDLQRLATGKLAQLIGKPQAVFALYGNGLYNNGSHLVDFIQMLFGEIRGVTTLSKERVGVVGCSGADRDLHASFSLDMGDFNVMAHAIDYNCYREFSLDIWGTEGRVFFCNETLSQMHYRPWDHRAMENQKEINCGHPAIVPINVERAFYNIYDMIENDTLPRATMDTQNILDQIADA